jgi:nicotinate-nucleotide--dimethylbenzimidazole phosphoribosyltransferase
MRLGEASGAALAIGLLRAALACHTGMASFAEAGVSGRANEVTRPSAAEGPRAARPRSSTT